MNLENFKKITIKIDSEKLIRTFLALVFLSAAVYRIFYPDLATWEFINLKLPSWLSPLMILFEIGAGLGLLINKYTEYIYCSIVVFLMIVLGWAFIIDGRNIINSIGELFVFNLNPTDWFLHLTFLFLTVVLLVKKREIKN